MTSHWAKRRRRRGKLNEIGEVLAQAFDKRGLTDQAKKIRIITAWRNAVGAKIARHTLAQNFSRGVLTVGADTPAWQQELNYLKSDLIQKLHATLNAKWVKDIRFVADSGRSKLAETPPRTRPLNTQDKERIRVTQALISDPEIQASFASLMSKELKRRI
jgi:hypothetical protein